MHTKKEFMKLSADFKECRDVLVALGDENRLHILYQMMTDGYEGRRYCKGVQPVTPCCISSYEDTQGCRGYKCKKGRDKELLLP